MNRKERRKKAAQARQTVRSSVMVRGLERAFEQNALGRELSPDVMPAKPCPHCGVICEAACHAHGGKPTPGDTTVCVVCSGASRFGADFGLVALSDADIEALPAQLRADVREGQALIRTALMSRGKVGDA